VRRRKTVKSVSRMVPILLTVTLIVGVFLMVTPARASSPNFVTTWQSLLGVYWHSYIQIRASFSDNGRHALTGAHRFWRLDGFDTGWRATSMAPGPWCSEIRSDYLRARDSLRGGDRHVMHHGWSFWWWTPGTPLPQFIPVYPSDSAGE